jgi:hypothetical protein
MPEPTDQNQWKVVSEAPAPDSSSDSDPTGQRSFRTGIGVPPPEPTAGSALAAKPAQKSWKVVSEVPAEQSVEGDSIDKALVNHPSLQKINKGLSDGVAKGFGLTTTDPDDPTKPNTFGGMAQEIWGNLKQSAIENYERGGGNVDGELLGGIGYVQKGIAAAMTPLNMAASGIEGMASMIEEGGKEMYEGATTGDHEKTARGFGKLLASGGQIAMGMERGAVNDVVGKVGAGVEKSAALPGNSLLRATNPKSYLYGKIPGRVFIDEPIKITTSLDNLAKQFDTAEDSLHTKLRDALTDPVVSAQKIDVVPVIDGLIKQAKDELANQKGLANRQGVIDAIDTVRNDIMNKYDSNGNVVGSWTKTKLSPLEVNELKRSVGKNTKWDTIPGSVDPEIQQYVNDVRKAVYGKLNDVVNDAAEKAKPGSNVKGLNGRFANLLEAQRLLKKRMAQEGSNELGMRRLMARGEWAASIGALLSGEPIAMTAGAVGIADRAMRSTPGRIARAQGGAAAGQALQGAAKTGTASNVAAIGATAATTGTQDWIQVQTSDGKKYDVHPEDVDKLKQKDPGMKILQTPDNDQE